MKYLQYILVLFVASSIIVSCTKDNYDPPSSRFSGKFTYKGNPINMSFGDASFELWDSGWGKRAAIGVGIAQDGSFSCLLFNENYKLIVQESRVPFMLPYNDKTNSDTMPLALNGNIDLNIEVTPYYTIDNIKMVMSTADSVTATLGLSKIITGVDAKDIERVTLYVTKTPFINSSIPVEKTITASDITDMKNIVVGRKVELKQIDEAHTAGQQYFYAAVGVKIRDVNTMICTPVQKLELK